MSMSNWYSEIKCLDKTELHKIATDLKKQYEPETVPIMVFSDAVKHLFKNESRYANCNTIDEPRVIFGS